MGGELRVLEDFLNEAKALAREGKIVEAGRFLRAAETKFPESSEIQFLLGACYAKINRADLARKAWTKSVTLAPANHRARAWLARLDQTDPTTFEVVEESGSGALAGDLDSCWDPTR